MTSLRNRLARLHKDQKGLEALQVIIIVAIAAVVLAFLYFMFNKGGTAGTGVRGWVQKNVYSIFSFSASKDGYNSTGTDVTDGK